MFVRRTHSIETISYDHSTTNNNNIPREMNGNKKKFENVSIENDPLRSEEPKQKHFFCSEKNQRFARYSHQYYNYIHYGTDIIAQHASSNEKFGLVKCATLLNSPQVSKTSNLFAVSKVYGTFFTNFARQRLYFSTNSRGYPHFQDILTLKQSGCKS